MTVGINQTWYNSTTAGIDHAGTLRDANPSIIADCGNLAALDQDGARFSGRAAQAVNQARADHSGEGSLFPADKATEHQAGNEKWPQFFHANSFRTLCRDAR